MGHFKDLASVKKYERIKEVNSPVECGDQNVTRLTSKLLSIREKIGAIRNSLEMLETEIAPILHNNVTCDREGSQPDEKKCQCGLMDELETISNSLIGLDCFINEIKSRVDI